ncbi:MAG: DnaJ domain-containing protein [Coprococcus sp.]
MPNRREIKKAYRKLSRKYHPDAQYQQSEQGGSRS